MISLAELKEKVPLTELNKKIVLSIIAALVGILAYTSAMDALFRQPFFNKLDESGNQYLDETLSRAVYTFAIVRGINGLISAAQGTQVSVAPAGMGIDFSVGEILDPINDMVERFSQVMLISTVSLGIQKVLMEIGTWLGFKVMLSFSMAVMLIAIWADRFFKTDLMSLSYKLILLSFIIRFCIPAIGLANEKIYDLFLKKEYTESLASLEKMNNSIKDSDITDQKEEKSGFMESLFQNAKELMDIKGKISAMKDKIAEYSKYMVNLIVVFILQTVVFPIFFLWLLMRSMGYAYSNIHDIIPRKLYTDRVPKQSAESVPVS
jgi:hypothetical protein